MLTKTELERRCNNEGLGFSGTSSNHSHAGIVMDAETSARRLRRQRRHANGSYRAASGWTTGLW